MKPRIKWNLERNGTQNNLESGNHRPAASHWQTSFHNRFWILSYDKAKLFVTFLQNNVYIVISSYFLAFYKPTYQPCEHREMIKKKPAQLSWESLT
jgi:hypothetical protein